MDNGETRRYVPKIKQNIVTVLPLPNSDHGTTEENMPATHLPLKLRFRRGGVVARHRMPGHAPLDFG
jgi:hypothetical protein